MKKNSGKHISIDTVEHYSDIRARLISQLVVMSMIIIALLILAIRWRNNQQIQTFSVSGNSAIRKEEIMALASLKPADTLGSTPGKYRLSEIRSQVMRHPFIQNAIVQTNGFKGIHIIIEERKPFLAIPTVLGKFDFIDSSGIVLPYEVFAQSGDVPIVYGLYKSGKIDTAVLSSLKYLVSSAQKRDGALQEFLSEIDYNQQSKSFTFITTDGATRVMFGSIDNAPKKFEKLHLYLQHASELSGTARYIDVRWKDQIVIGKPLALASKL